MADDLESTIRESAQGPAKVSGDAGSMEQHSLPDQIAADRYLAARKAARSTAPFRTLTHQWFWDGQEHVDPAKEASAQATRLQSHTTTLAYEYARQGRDWESELRQRAKEFALMQHLGLSMSPSPSAANSEKQDDPQPTDEEE